MIARGVARRAVALAAVALVAVVLAFSADSFTADDGPTTTTREITPVAVPGAGWYQALAAPYPPSSRRVRTACGQPLGPRTLGVAHPVLPCGVKLFIGYDETVVLTQVIDRGPAVAGRDFDLTRALARRLGLTGTQQIRWRYAR